MATMPRDERYQACWDAIARRVCGVCLDQASDGGCGLGRGRRCAIEGHLPAVVETILSIESGRMDEYVAAMEVQAR